MTSTPYAAPMALPAEPFFLGTLDAHLGACERARGRGFALRCIGDRVNDWVAPRFCTTVLVAAAVIGALAVWA